MHARQPYSCSKSTQNDRVYLRLWSVEQHGCRHKVTCATYRAIRSHTLDNTCNIERICVLLFVFLRLCSTKHIKHMCASSSLNAEREHPQSLARQNACIIARSDYTQGTHAKTMMCRWYLGIVLKTLRLFKCFCIKSLKPILRLMPCCTRWA